MNRIKRISVFFRVLFQILLVTLPILLLTAWLHSAGEIMLFGGMIDINFIPLNYYGKILHPLSQLEKILALATSVLPTLLQLYILFSLIKLFKLYEVGEIFSSNNVRYIRNIGYALLIMQIIDPIYQCLMGWVLTSHNPPGQRFMSIFIDQKILGMILIALLVILISWIMSEGCKLREEQELTV